MLRTDAEAEGFHCFAEPSGSHSEREVKDKKNKVSRVSNGKDAGRNSSEDYFARTIAFLSLILAVVSSCQTWRSTRASEERECSNLLDQAWNSLSSRGGGLYVPGGPALTKSERVELEIALRYIDKALEIDSSNPKALTLKAIYFSKREMWPDAIANYREALRQEADRAFALNGLGNALEKFGNSKEALRCYEKATEIDPSFPVPYLNWGLALVRAGSLEEAKRVLERGIEADPGFAPNYQNLGNVHFTLSEWNEAKILFRRCLEVDREHRGCKNNLYQVGLREGLDSNKSHAEVLSFLRGIAVSGESTDRADD